jgi:hypothetical protein
MHQHYETLWESAEQELATQTAKLSTQELINQLILQLTAYQKLDQAEETPADLKTGLKTQWFGEVLLSLTQLSYLEQVNTFTALETALERAKILSLAQKYQLTPSATQ